MTSAELNQESLDMDISACLQSYGILELSGSLVEWILHLALTE